MSELVVHQLVRPHLQLALLRLRTKDYHKHVVEADCAFIGHTNLAQNRIALIISHRKFTSDVKLKALKNH